MRGSAARRGVSGLVALAAVGGLSVVGAAAANAYPSSCNLSSTSTSVSVSCSGGAGSDRAWV